MQICMQHTICEYLVPKFGYACACRPQHKSRLCTWQHRQLGRSRQLDVRAQAKKKGGGSKKKQAGSLMDPPKPANPYLETSVIMHNLLMVESYKRKVGKPIMDDAEIQDIAQLMWEAPFAVLSHDLEESSDAPKFDYANKAALDLMEASWEELVGKPSNAVTEDTQDTENLNTLLAEVGRAGTSSVHSRWLKGLKGRDFCISNGLMWNIETATGLP
ncbi:hypothetical protein ABBQ32_007752 [Trebouxia sp. C0010 RCD-2024]